VIRVDILDPCPIFIYGLTQVLRGAGIQVLGSRTKPAQQFDWHADVSLIDPETLAAGQAADYVAGVAKFNTVLVVTNDTASPAIWVLRRAGAAGVVSKCEPADEIIDAIRAVATGATWLGPALADSAATRDDETEKRQSGTLSKREEQVLRQISCGLTHGQVAYRLGISQHTVDTYVKRIRSKLGLGNKAELTRAALVCGFGRPQDDQAWRSGPANEEADALTLSQRVSHDHLVLE
jgi:DNA-binding NarL/FixJ family response regulator